LTVAYRAAELADREFIIDTWLRSYRLSRTAGLIAMDDWRSVMWPQIAKILDRPSVTTMVAFDPDETGRLVDLFGFVCADVTEGTPLVFYVYVKGAYRGWGYARGLFAALDINPRRRFAYACDTYVVSELREAGKIPRAYFDQVSARFPNKNAPRKDTRNEQRSEVIVETVRTRSGGSGGR
jgi:GNAT superfamily N-acetyltransferase